MQDIIVIFVIFNVNSIIEEADDKLDNARHKKDVWVKTKETRK